MGAQIPQNLSKERFCGIIFCMENKFNNIESGIEKKKLDYIKLLESIAINNGELALIAQKFLERKDLLEIVSANIVSGTPFYGVNSIEQNSENKIDIQGIQINENNITEEIVIHELVHFFSMPALQGGLSAQQNNTLENISPNVAQYWQKMKALWDYVNTQNYSSRNSSSMSHDIVEFAVNFTNKESSEKLKEINVYDSLMNTFFEYYNSLKVN